LKFPFLIVRSDISIPIQAICDALCMTRCIWTKNRRIYHFYFTIGSK